jgi:AraC family transcriptional regulator
MHRKEIYRKEYINRLNKVIDYIDNHIDEELNLDSLAALANFSPFHFHRIFSAFMGETPNSFINRLRVEKAARLLLYEPEMTVSEVSVRCGFNSDSVFCRNFKSHFGVSSQEFINQTIEEDERRIRQLKSKIHQFESKNHKLETNPTSYIRNENNTKKWRLIMKKQVEVKDLPALNLVYTRHTGAFDQIGKAYEKLFKWAGARGLLNGGDFHTVTVYHDDPKVTDVEKVRQSACLTVVEGTKAGGEFGTMKLPGGKHMVGHFEIDVMEFEEAWNTMCVEMADSGYQPAEGNPYEYYYKDPADHPEHKFVLDICIPVKPV